MNFKYQNDETICETPWNKFQTKNKKKNDLEFFLKQPIDL